MRPALVGRRTFYSIVIACGRIHAHKFIRIYTFSFWGRFEGSCISTHALSTVWQCLYLYAYALLTQNTLFDYMALVDFYNDRPCLRESHVIFNNLVSERYICRRLLCWLEMVVEQDVTWCERNWDGNYANFSCYCTRRRARSSPRVFGTVDRSEHAKCTDQRIGHISR